MSSRRPLVPPEVDLRDFPWMELQVNKIRDSDQILVHGHKALGAALLLWCAAWHQVPAGSLPKNNDALRRLSMLESAEWEEIAPAVMRKWVECSDGRLYHPLLAERALDAWRRKQLGKKRTAKAKQATKRRWAEHRRRNNRDGDRDALRDALRDGDRESRRDRNRDTELARPAGRANPAPGRKPPVAAPIERDGLRDALRDGDRQPHRNVGDKDKDSINDASTHSLLASLGESGSYPAGLIDQIMARFDRLKGLAYNIDQRDSVIRLADRAVMEDRPLDWCKRYLDTAWRLKTSGRGLWHNAPWAPHAICGKKMMLKVEEAMSDDTGTDEQFWTGDEGL